MLRIYQNTIFATFIAVPNPKTINPSWRRLLIKSKRVEGYPIHTTTVITSHRAFLFIHPNISFRSISDRFQIDLLIDSRSIPDRSIDSRSIDPFCSTWSGFWDFLLFPSSGAQNYCLANEMASYNKPIIFSDVKQRELFQIFWCLCFIADTTLSFMDLLNCSLISFVWKYIAL